MRNRRVMMVLAALAAVTLQPSVACLSEILVLEPFVVQRLTGRIELPVGTDSIPRPLSFLVYELEAEDPAQWDVTVLDNGEFDLGLPEGEYEYTLEFEDYLFTVTGRVTVTRNAEPEARVFLGAPWC